MKTIWLILKSGGMIGFFLIISARVGGQTIKNLRFEQVGKTIQISYDLQGKANEIYSIEVFANRDNGAWEGPLRYVTGEVGESIKPGSNKKITWDVLKEKDILVGEIKFKVEATLRSGCRSFTITHNAGSTAPVTKKITYGVVETNLTCIKKCWITQNLGADRQATSATDATEASAGWYWQFNRKQGFKHDGISRTPNTKWNYSINENNDWQSANDPCNLILGSGWRLPTKTEWENADATGGWANYKEAFGSVLKLHAAGYLGGSGGALGDRGSYGYYWSSSQAGSDYGWNLYFYSGFSGMSGYDEAYGFSSRCLRD